MIDPIPPHPSNLLVLLPPSFLPVIASSLIVALTVSMGLVVFKGIIVSRSQAYFQNGRDKGDRPLINMIKWFHLSRPFLVI